MNHQSKLTSEANALSALVVNADDWGRDRPNTDRTLECIQAGAVSSVSAMVFMEDSERAAEIAQQCDIDAGLHLNFTAAFSMPGCSSKLEEHRERLGRHLRSSRFASIVFHPGLANSFKYVVESQLEEFRRIYGRDADRVDGHHHMHLCANVLLAKLLPDRSIVRRNFTFTAGEKGAINRLYRKTVDRRLSRRHTISDLFFSIEPLEPRERLKRIFDFADDCVVELETHPVSPIEHEFLAGGEIFRWIERSKIQSFRKVYQTVTSVRSEKSTSAR
jgi:predicted glycoside hydrolase/deacetylase ChbG (UPF0249 family)